MRIWNGSFGWPWSRAAGLRSSRSAASRASFATRISATPWEPEGVEQFVSTPELHSDEAIETDPLAAGAGLGGEHGDARDRPWSVPD